MSRLRVFVRVLPYTGMQSGQATAVRVRRHLVRRRIDVVHTAIELNGEMTYGSPKTHQRRSVPVPHSLVDELAAHVAGKGPDDLVFTTPRGDVMRNHNFRRRLFASAAKQIGMPGRTPHDLRHTAASLAVRAGANVKAVCSATTWMPSRTVAMPPPLRLVRTPLRTEAKGPDVVPLDLDDRHGF